MPRSPLTRLPLVGHLFRKVDPTPEDVRAFWAAMQKQWATTQVNKANATEMQAVAELLDLLGITNKQDFLRNFTTVLGEKIYTPFDPGVPTHGWPLWSQIRVCVHEHHHVWQFRAAGGLGFMWNYVASPADRAHYEAEAYRCDMVMEYHFRGRMLEPKILASYLSSSYGCSETDALVMERMLVASIPAIKSGARPSDVLRWAVPWLEARWKLAA